jgi:4-hydroxybenzoate polyprenyltransferase
MSSLVPDPDPDPGHGVGIPLIARKLAARSPILGSLRKAMSFVRYRESLLLEGAPLLGAAFAIGRLTPEKAAALGVLTVASFFLIVHVFLVNDWAGMTADLRDPHRTVRPLEAMVGRRVAANLGIALLLASLLLFALLEVRTLLIALAIAFLSALYSLPHPSGKGIPLVSSAVHLLGGILHFLLGYSAFSPIDPRGLSVAFFFGLTLTAGHWNHEARDLDADRLNRIRTNAVAFGREKVFLASAALFAVAYAYLTVLAERGLVPRPLRFVGLLYPFQFYASWATLRSGLCFQSIRRLQIWYRALFAVIGLGMLAALSLGR